MDDKIDVLTTVAEALTANDDARATRVLEERYPFEPITKKRTSFSQSKMLRIYMRDGFTDRYSGQRLILPGALIVMSHRLPDAFPLHANWKSDETHMAYYDLWPSIDHVVPVGRGGSNDDNNLVTTSYVRNLAKGMWTLEELKWEKLPVKEDGDWDGLTGWFMQMVDADPGLLDATSIRNWHAAVKRVRVQAY